jgi:hypothetical protein
LQQTGPSFLPSQTPVVGLEGGLVVDDLLLLDKQGLIESFTDNELKVLMQNLDAIDRMNSTSVASLKPEGRKGSRRFLVGYIQTWIRTNFRSKIEDVESLAATEANCKIVESTLAVLLSKHSLAVVEDIYASFEENEIEPRTFNDEDDRDNAASALDEDFLEAFRSRTLFLKRILQLGIIADRRRTERLLLVATDALQQDEIEEEPPDVSSHRKSLVDNSKNIVLCFLHFRMRVSEKIIRLITNTVIRSANSSPAIIRTAICNLELFFRSRYVMLQQYMVPYYVHHSNLVSCV